MAVKLCASRYCIIIPPSWLDHLLAVLSDKTTGAVSCSSQIQFTVDQPLACLPTSVSGNDDFVIPSGSVYAPSFVQNTVIQEFITINNININEIIINVINISNNTIIPKPPTVSLWTLVFHTFTYWYSFKVSFDARLWFYEQCCKSFNFLNAVNGSKDRSSLPSPKSLAEWSCSACAIASLCLQVCSDLAESIACDILWWARWATQAYSCVSEVIVKTPIVWFCQGSLPNLSECIRPIRPIDGQPKKEGQQYWFFWGAKA